MSVAIFFLTYGIGAGMMFIGISQLRKPLIWNDYIPDFMHPILHSQQREALIMRVYALGNIILGFFLISNFMTLYAAWFALLWWIAVAPFGFIKKWDIGVRDSSIVFALAALIALLI